MSDEMLFTKAELQAACELAANETKQRLAALADKCAAFVKPPGDAPLRAFAAVLRDDIGLNQPAP